MTDGFHPDWYDEWLSEQKPHVRLLMIPASILMSLAVMFGGIALMALGVMVLFSGAWLPFALVIWAVDAGRNRP